MTNYRMAIALLILGSIIIALTGSLFSTQEWKVTEGGFLEISPTRPEYRIMEAEGPDNPFLREIQFISRDREIAGLLRFAAGRNSSEVPGIVLLPGAGVTKEMEQGLAEYLSSLGMATLTIDQRNLGAIDPQGDLQAFVDGRMPVEHEMVSDALLAAEVLRDIPGIDAERIIYMGESNGARFAIIASALDSKCRGALAISTCGYGIEDAVASGALTDPQMICFYRSIDPETYLSKIPPRRLAMIHSANDTVISYRDALRTYSKASQPKAMHTVDCHQHGYCSEMQGAIKEELKTMA